MAFTDEATLPAPQYVATAPASDLHSHSGYDMVIFTPASLKSAAERVAAIHRAEPDTMRVAVVDVEHDGGHSLRYALIMGRTTYDNRHLTADMQRATWPTVPGWVNRDEASSLSDTYGFVTDDFIAMLNDAKDQPCVAVGRIPAATASDASSVVDKLEQYMSRSSRTPWKNVVVVLADDGDAGVHIQQADSMATYLLATPGQQHLVSKVYTDAYELVGGVYQQARDDLYRRLDEGAVWWTYIGHASNHSWTGEGILTFTHNNNMYLRNVPFIYAATCNFLRWDSNTISGGEIMHAERNGGCIGIISATRPVFITDNGYFSNAMGRAMAARDASGRLLRAGDVYRTAKNNILNSYGCPDDNSNRLGLVFGGDPAMRLATPSNVVRIDSIDGRPYRPDDQPTLAALQQAVVSGHVEAPDGTVLDGFNGTATLELYDAEQSFTTHGNNKGAEITFDTQGSKLLTMATPVSGGRFRARVAMPADISDNFRPATFNIYAVTADGSSEAVGVGRGASYASAEPPRPTPKPRPSTAT